MQKNGYSGRKLAVCTKFPENLHKIVVSCRLSCCWYVAEFEDSGAERTYLPDLILITNLATSCYTTQHLLVNDNF